MSDDKKKSCADLVMERLESRAADFVFFMMHPSVRMYGNEGAGLQPLIIYSDNKWVHTYGLCLDYHVACRGGYWDETPDYYDYVLSWGGPSELVRFHPDGKIEYRYHDWWDGAGVDVTEEVWAEWLRDFFTLDKNFINFARDRMEAADVIKSDQQSAG